MSFEDKDGWSCYLSPSVSLHQVDRDNFTVNILFTLIIIAVSYSRSRGLESCLKRIPTKIFRQSRPLLEKQALQNSHCIFSTTLFNSFFKINNLSCGKQVHLKKRFSIVTVCIFMVIRVARSLWVAVF